MNPDREPDTGTSIANLITYTILGLVAIVCCSGAAWLARHNLTQGRGDQRGAFRIGLFMFTAQMALWLTRSHLTASAGTFGNFFIALATSVFYGVLIWTLYLALEPYVRRRWPHTLISWSSVLIGRVRDAVVGRDVLVGCLFGVGIAAAGLIGELIQRRLGGWTPDQLEPRTLLGLRGTLATCVMAVPHGIRETLFFFLLILLLRVLLRNQWVAGAVFVLLWSALSLGGNNPLPNFLKAAVIYSAVAVMMLRWGLLTTAVSLFVVIELSNAPYTTRVDVWYFDSFMLMLSIVAALAIWASRTSIAGRRIWKEDLLE